MALSSAQGEAGHLGPMDDAGAPNQQPMDAQSGSGGNQSAAAGGSTAFKILTQPAEGQVMDNGDGTFSFDTGGDFQDLAIGETRQVSFSFLLERSEVVTATVVVAATPDGPVAKDVSYVSDGDGLPAPTAEPTPEAMQAPADPAPFDAAPMADLGTMAFAEPGETEPQASVQQAAPEFEMAPSIPAEPEAAAESDQAGFGSEPMTPLADLDFAAAPPVSAAPEPSEADPVQEMPDSLAELALELAPEPAPEPVSEPAAEALPPEGQIEILSQPEAGSVSNNGDGTFSFDPGDAFQDLADGQTREVSFTLRLADGAVMTAVVTVAGDPAGPIAQDVTFLAQDDSAAATDFADEQALEAPTFGAPAPDALAIEEESFAPPPPLRSANPSPVDPWDQTPATMSAAPAQASPEPDLVLDESEDLALEPSEPQMDMASGFDAPTPSWEPEPQEPAFERPDAAASESSDDLFGGSPDMAAEGDSSGQEFSAAAPSASADFFVEPEAPVTDVEATPEPARLPERQAAMDDAANGGFDSGFAGFSDFEPASADVGAEEPAVAQTEWDAEPVQADEPATPASDPLADASPSAFGDFDRSFAAEPASDESAMAESRAEPAFAAPAAAEDDFPGMDGERRVDTLQLSGVSAGPGTGGWNVELSKGRIVDIQDGCVILSAGSSGTLVLDDSSVRVSFDGIERIVW